jgi:hypothetical protein
VRKKIDAPSEETSHNGLPPAVLMFQCRDPKVKDLRRIELACKQSLFGLVETDRVAEIFLGEFQLASSVAKKTSFLGDGLDRKRLAFSILNSVARPEANSSQRSVVASVFALLSARLELYGDGSRGKLENGAQPQFGFAFTDPSLSSLKLVRHDPWFPREENLQSTINEILRSDA